VPERASSAALAPKYQEVTFSRPNSQTPLIPLYPMSLQSTRLAPHLSGWQRQRRDPAQHVSEHPPRVGWFPATGEQQQPTCLIKRRPGFTSRCCKLAGDRMSIRAGSTSGRHRLRAITLDQSSTSLDRERWQGSSVIFTVCLPSLIPARPSRASCRTPPPTSCHPSLDVN
jgi:hypothetical protein